MAIQYIELEPTFSTSLAGVSTFNGQPDWSVSALWWLLIFLVCFRILWPGCRRYVEARMKQMDELQKLLDNIN